ncbi:MULTISPECIES: hypothetical protein [Saccharothrix]|uniref:hypothetical protein n=1 Tax=Saccharothrix TaxID=2071 RepID=UPI00093B6DAA|nr:hypothetical protein [Saccharothrix sp. CB00851]OKI18214.1 hypothetical protein A6A25_11665 [Saccharothrix sp. CB00851]
MSEDAMDWQDTLRRLDADLAAGRISPAEHTKRRDQVLAEAASGRPAPHDPDSTQVIRVTSPAPPAPWAPVPRGPSLDGAAVFATARKPRRKGSALVVLAVLALAAASIWWFAIGTGTTGDAAPPPTTSTSQSAQPTIPELPGTKGAHGPVLTVDDAVRLKLIALDEADVLKGNGVTEILFANATAARTSYAVVVARTGSSEQAEKVAEGLTGHLVAAGYTRTPEQYLTKAFPQNTVLRVVYRSGDAVVRVGAAQAGAQAPTADLGTVLEKIREAWPEN